MMVTNEQLQKELDIFQTQVQDNTLRKVITANSKFIAIRNPLFYNLIKTNQLGNNFIHHCNEKNKILRNVST